MQKQRGFTLAELLFAIGFAAAALLGGYGIYLVIRILQNLVTATA